MSEVVLAKLGGINKSVTILNKRIDTLSVTASTKGDKSKVMDMDALSKKYSEPVSPSIIKDMFSSSPIFTEYNYIHNCHI